jgi:hypothetical protein
VLVIKKEKVNEKKKHTRCSRRVASRASAAAACVGCRWPLLACVVLAVVEKIKTYQRLETCLRLEPLSLLLRAMPVVMVVTIGSLLLSGVVFGVVFVSVVVI